MSMISIKATEVARRLSEILNRVKYQGHGFEVTRGREVVARIVPAGSSRRLKVSELARVFQEIPRLEAGERKAFRKDLKAIRKKTPRLDDPWA
jgi:antitoxin (DNA-binding transcriptional repressor) of toxin-antitoxin stability system